MALVSFKCQMNCVYVDIIHVQPIHMINSVTCAACAL